MKSNIVIKVVAVTIALILLVIVLKSNKSTALNTNNDLQSIENGPIQEDNGLSLEGFQNDYLEDELGVDVDTPLETMRTLTNETRAVREKSIELQDENKKLKHEISRLLEMEDNIKKRVQSKFNQVEKDTEVKQRELEHTQDLTKGLIEKLEKRLQNLSSEKPKKKGLVTAQGYDISSADIPAGLGYDETGQTVNYDDIVWVNPMDAKEDPKSASGMLLPDFDSSIFKETTLAAKQSLPGSKEDDVPSIKAYTIPINSTLIGSVSMTAMLGRIPTNGQVVDPYPFKVMVGPDNLSSNGIHIPNVTGIKMSGVAKGDWTLSCISGEIHSMTFTFQDGTIKTIPEPGSKANEPLAWFSDENGIPCVTGLRITNAASYLSSRIGLTAASSYANAEAQSQFTNSSNSSGSSSTLTGSPSTVAKNTAISSSLNDVTDWLDSRQQNSFDAIYAPPGTKLVLHINHELKIDYNPLGRKVNHYANTYSRSKYHLD